MASAEARKHRRKSTERFECTSEPMVEEPFDFLTRGRGLFDKVCQCEYDWKDTYCLNLYIYLNMDVHNAPKICICRKNGENTKTCNQFMTKCFNDGNIKSTRCRCCFNQPDPYCRQLDCKNMHPDFGQNSNTSCMCYDQTDYPRHLCSGYYTAAILPPETTSETFMLTDYIPTTVASASVLSSTTPSIFSTLKEKLDNGVVLALIIVLAAGIGIGFYLFYSWDLAAF
uniref:Uncharacterized protein n=1 Tax=Acrobeloides nanus TaxID=290746 RepID=A0A914EB22_9BILA